MLSEGRSIFGHTLNPQLGLIMVGGAGISPPYASESTKDGIIIDGNTVAPFGEQVYGHCLVSVNETTLISFGGEESTNYRKIAVNTIGSGDWEVNFFLLFYGDF